MACSTCITGCEGIPSLENAGNVLLPKLTVKLSIRIPPTCDASVAGEAVKEILEKDPPFGAKVKFKLEKMVRDGTPLLSILTCYHHRSGVKRFLRKKSAFIGEGGSIPFMGMLGKKFPRAQFLITGVLGPHSNAHGPNEFLHIPTAKKLTGCVAKVISQIDDLLNK